MLGLSPISGAPISAWYIPPAAPAPSPAAPGGWSLLRHIGVGGMIEPGPREDDDALMMTGLI